MPSPVRHLLIATVVSLGSVAALASDYPPVEVFAPKPCLACIDWAEHLRDAGFAVKVTEVDDLPAIKRRLGVPKDLESVHTATVAGYFVEGHVPAEDIKELLKEKPRARGIAVPGTPIGAPGRENSNPFCETACTMLDGEAKAQTVRRELFETLLVDKQGKVSRWARH